MFKYHDELGHIGVEKVYEAICKSYWFPEMRKKISIHVKNCCKCIAYAPSTGKVEGFAQRIPKGTKPFEMVHIDHEDIFDSRVPGKKTHLSSDRWVH